jgi:hypothetical protein
MKAAELFYKRLIHLKFGRILILIERYCMSLNEIRKILAANPERSPLMHSYYYASAGDRPALFARISLSFVPFMHYAG